MYVAIVEIYSDGLKGLYFQFGKRNFWLLSSTYNNMVLCTYILIDWTDQFVVVFWKLHNCTTLTKLCFIIGGVARKGTKMQVEHQQIIIKKVLKTTTMYSSVCDCARAVGVAVYLVGCGGTCVYQKQWAHTREWTREGKRAYRQVINAVRESVILKMNTKEKRKNMVITTKNWWKFTMSSRLNFKESFEMHVHEGLIGEASHGQITANPVGGRFGEQIGSRGRMKTGTGVAFSTNHLLLCRFGAAGAIFVYERGTEIV